MKNDCSKLVNMEVYNIGCFGPEGIRVELDDILCIVGPNNAGKSTLLRAYELAVGNGKLDDNLRSLRCPLDGKPTVVIEFHIPKETPNVAEKWKTARDGLLVVKSRWQWNEEGKPTRETWNPEANDWAEKGKAGGADSVFSARLPKPLRVGALQDPKAEQDTLLKLVLQDVLKGIKAATEDDTELKKAIDSVVEQTRASLNSFKAEVEAATADVNKQFRRVFPSLSVDLRIDVAEDSFDLEEMVKGGSSVDIREGDATLRWNQQGTGAQRALFWSMIGVRSRLETEKKKPKATAPATNPPKKAGGKKAAGDDSDVGLPSYMLLIDEPETALHPNAIRAARRYLYELASTPAWQVMLTTHSPLFIDPTEDHTTIVRLERTGDKLTPRTFRSDAPDFTADDKDKLKVLLKFDSGLAEMFFGGFPIVVEGDTEFAAFEAVMEGNREAYPLESRPLIIRARGKHTIVPIIKVFRQFKVSFAVLHDSDTPRTAKGKSNATAWSANQAIREQVVAAAVLGDAHTRVTYRTSIPNFEEAHGIEPVEKDKPWNAVSTIKVNAAVAASVRAVLDDLCNPTGDLDVDASNDALTAAVEAWGKARKAEGDPRFVFTT